MSVLRTAREVTKRGLRILAGMVLGGGAGTLLGFAYLMTERCAGPACAGLIVVPILTGCAGLVVGLVVAVHRVLFRSGRGSAQESSDAD